MAKNEIKLRKQLIDEEALQRHRNYALLLQRHENEQRRKRTRRIFVYSTLVALIVILLLIIISYVMVKWERDREMKKGVKVTLSSSPKEYGQVV